MRPTERRVRPTGGGVTASEPSAFVIKDAHGRPGAWGADVPAYPWFTSSTDRRRPDDPPVAPVRRPRPPSCAP
jgi:hypothetical protein